MTPTTEQVMTSRALVDYIRDHQDQTIFTIAAIHDKPESWVWQTAGLYMATTKVRAAFEEGRFNVNVLYCFSILEPEIQDEMISNIDHPDIIPMAFARNKEFLKSKPRRVAAARRKS